MPQRPHLILSQCGVKISAYEFRGQNTKIQTIADGLEQGNLLEAERKEEFSFRQIEFEMSMKCLGGD